MISRRKLLGAASIGLLAPKTLAAREVDPIPRAPREQLDGFMRLFAGKRGACVLTNEGIIYGRAPGELARPLIAYLAVLQIKPEEIAPAVFRTTQVEAMVCLDLATRAPLREWRNPYTGETVIPVGYASPRNIYHFDVTGTYGAVLPPTRSGRIQLDWRASNDDIWVTEARRNSYPSNITEAEFPRAYAGPVRDSVDILTYRARIRDFRRDASFTPATLTMLSDAPWPLWMMMAKRLGGVLWHGFGTKYRTLGEVPAVHRRTIDAVYPGFLQDPFLFPAAEWGTAAQLRRLKRDGRMR